MTPSVDIVSTSDAAHSCTSMSSETAVGIPGSEAAPSSYDVVQIQNANVPGPSSISPTDPVDSWVRCYAGWHGEFSGSTSLSCLCSGEHGVVQPPNPPLMTVKPIKCSPSIFRGPATVRETSPLLGRMASCRSSATPRTYPRTGTWHTSQSEMAGLVPFFIKIWKPVVDVHSNSHARDTDPAREKLRRIHLHHRESPLLTQLLCMNAIISGCDLLDIEKESSTTSPAHIDSRSQQVRIDTALFTVHFDISTQPLTKAELDRIGLIADFFSCVGFSQEAFALHCNFCEKSHRRPLTLRRRPQQ